MQVLRSVIIVCVLSVVLGAVVAVHEHIYGGKHPVSVDDPNVKQVTKWAATRLGGKCVSITKAEVQVVSGVNYYITFTMKKSGKAFSCKVRVWTQVWLHHTEMTEYHCTMLHHIYSNRRA